MRRSKCHLKLEAKGVYQTNLHAGRQKGRKMPFLSLVTLTLTFALDFKVIRARDQARLPREFRANPFIGSGDISYTIYR